jgi:F-type H+-transporting ATPase subunit epsilon
MGEVDSVLFLTHDGQMEVLAGHEPVAAPVEPCVLRLRTAEGEKLAAAMEGFITITQTKVEVFLDAAEWTVEIDRKRAEAALERAEKRLSEGAMSWELSRARSAAARAKVRLAALGAAKENREAS